MTNCTYEALITFEYETLVDGDYIDKPYEIGVAVFENHRGDRRSWASDLEYCGFIEMEWDLLDPAVGFAVVHPSLISSDMKKAIEAHIIETLSGD